MEEVTTNQRSRVDILEEDLVYQMENPYFKGIDVQGGKVAIKKAKDKFGHTVYVIVINDPKSNSWKGYGIFSIGQNNLFLCGTAPDNFSNYKVGEVPVSADAALQLMVNENANNNLALVTQPKLRKMGVAKNIISLAMELARSKGLQGIDFRGCNRDAKMFLQKLSENPAIRQTWNFEVTTQNDRSLVWK